MSAATKRRCPKCNKIKSWRSDVLSCPDCNRPSKKQLRETSRIKGDQWHIVLPNTQIRTVQQLAQYLNVDESWEIEKFEVSKYETADGDAFKVTATFRRRENLVAIMNELEDLRKLGREIGVKVQPVKLAEKDGRGKCLVISLTDHHFGKLAWSPETRSVNFDLKLATKLYARALKAILDRAPFKVFDEVVLVIGNDLLHTDNSNGTTTSGTQVDSDGRYHRTFATVRNALIATICLLRARAKKVKVIAVPGNHDRLSSWHMADSLQSYFHDVPEVEIWMDSMPVSRSKQEARTCVLSKEI